MRKVTELIEMLAVTQTSVLITGESGTGKEVVARAIHASGPRRFMPMVMILYPSTRDIGLNAFWVAAS